MKYDLIINGCSFTKYLWPTWADFLCAGFEDRINIGNWAMGSDYILYTTYPYIKDAGPPYDTKFIINWPFYHKFDNKKDGEWNTLGNVHNARNKDKVIQDHYYYFYDDDYWFEKTAINIQIVNDLLNAKNLTCWYTSAEDYSLDNRGTGLKSIYNKSNFLIKEFHNIGLNDKEKAKVWKNGRFDFKDQYDWHPMCTTQLSIAKQISKQTDIKMIDADFEKIANDIDKRIYRCDDILNFKQITLDEYIDTKNKPRQKKKPIFGNTFYKDPNKFIYED